MGLAPSRPRNHRRQLSLQHPHASFPLIVPICPSALRFLDSQPRAANECSYMSFPTNCQSDKGFAWYIQLVHDIALCSACLSSCQFFLEFPLPHSSHRVASAWPNCSLISFLFGLPLPCQFRLYQTSKSGQSLRLATSAVQRWAFAAISMTALQCYAREPKPNLSMALAHPPTRPLHDCHESPNPPTAYFHCFPSRRWDPNHFSLPLSPHPSPAHYSIPMCPWLAVQVKVISIIFSIIIPPISHNTDH
ncbi:uncharacterized protein EI90DRAFT_2248939 [Cantharellus anzutake]|uniref:uncharacterized protein n=1 Tax=Cantharellus anzutake TaxID=1750568 RepID=UPI0019031219|nr:uncharacterized protein EI90DRAFT_2248939 [Cantharellus anzutake]KAF8339537.1 hypothetical protein EI90DRAFT_2248939 [Cantharellus anzutake]